MDIKILNPIEFANWNQQIVDLPGSTIFHTDNWARVLSETYGYQPRYICKLHRGRLQNVIPVMEINSPFTGKRGVSLPFSDRVDPLIDDRYTFDQMFETLTAFARSKGWKSIYFHGGNKFFQSDQSYKSYINSFINLNGSSQSLFQKFKSNTRRNIKKAEMSGLITKFVGNRNGITSFYRLNCLTRRKHGLPPQPFKFFEKIYDYLISTGKGYICLTFHNGQPVSGVVFLSFNRTAFYKYGASDKRFLLLRPNNLSMWHAIQRCSDAEFETIDLGRSDTGHQGLLQYKRGWNAKETVINYYKYNVREKKFSSQKTKLNSFYFLFKQLPMPLLKIIGETVSRHIG